MLLGGWNLMIVYTELEKYALFGIQLISKNEDAYINLD